MFLNAPKDINRLQKLGGMRIVSHLFATLDIEQQKNYEKRPKSDAL